MKRRSKGYHYSKGFCRTNATNKVVTMGHCPGHKKKK